MNEWDIENVKEEYSKYKETHYEDEREMRKILKLKKIVPSLVADETLEKDYKELNSKLTDGLYYYNQLKKMLSDEELKAFVEKVKYSVMKKRYFDFKLHKLENDFSKQLKKDEVLFLDAFTPKTKEVLAEEGLDKTLFAETILAENELLGKIEVICRYQRATLDVFFDTTAIMKAELARLFMEQMNVDEVEKNEVITACLVYAFKRIQSPKEIERVKKEKEMDKIFLQELGFDKHFCKICLEYNRYNEPEGYIREKEGDILELIDKMVGLLMYREDRPAFPVEEALDILETKILAGKNNPYEVSFRNFIEKLEKVEVSRFIGVVTFFANQVNGNARHAILDIMETVSKIRELVGGSVSEDKIKKLERIEKLQDKNSMIENLQSLNEKTTEKIASLSKILRGYKNLSESDKVE